MDQLRTQCFYVPIRKRRSDPSRNPVQHLDFCDVSQCCAWSKCGKMLDDEMLGQIVPQTLFFVFSCPTPQMSSECLNTYMSTALEWYRQGRVPVSYPIHRCHGILTRNIEALCKVLRSIHGFVQYCTHRLHVVP